MESELGPLARELRMDLGWTLRKVEWLSGVSSSTISRLENGDVKISLLLILRVFKALGYRVAFAVSPSGVYFVEEVFDAKLQ